MNHILLKIGWKILGRKELHIDKDLCIKCGKCHRTCSHNAIFQDVDKSFKIGNDNCHRCYHCLENCPKKAINEK
ncbi:MAG: 4Fe-4S binding protein [Anaerostipes sp.]|nr:4Fe-4S binding protein [Anaerostipes sp.]